MAEEHGSVIYKLVQDEPVVEVNQDADSQLSQQRKSRIHALHKNAGS